MIRHRYLQHLCFSVVLLGACYSNVYSQAPTSQVESDTSANGAAPTPVLPPWPAMKLPEARSTDELNKFVIEVKKLQPTTPERYREMQTWIRDASQRILEMTADRTSELGRTAEFDFISSSVMLMGNEGPDAQKKTFERFRDYVKAKSMPDANDLKMVLMACQNLEQLDDGKTAAGAYRDLAMVLEDKDNTAFVVWIDMLNANAKRVELPGKKFEISGKTVTGEDFEIKSCLGKYTLIYFWSSWCKPCREEYGYMKKLYLDNREKGFEIVAVSVDEEREKLEAFLRELEVPWINLWDEKNRSSPVATQQYGISAIPTMILLDREGKVVSLEARGLILGRLLEKFYAQEAAKK
jgi:thiol-disulfide isomerase/thioredoxin